MSQAQPKVGEGESGVDLTAYRGEAGSCHPKHNVKSKTTKGVQGVERAE